MNSEGRLCVKLIHCGNNSLANPEDQCEKNIFFMPMGLFSLAAALVENGIDAEIINSDSEKGKDIDEILEFRELDAVGFDCHWVNQSLAVLETAELIKRIKPEVFIFLGGFTASLFAEEILRGYPQIDAVMRGDADIPIVELCNALNGRSRSEDGFVRARNGRSLSQVRNLVWRDVDGRVQMNDFSYVATSEDIEKLDFAAVDLLRNWEYYRKRSIYWTRFAPLNFAPLNLSPLFFLEVGRGCSNRCLFCGGSAEAQRQINRRRGVVSRSVDSVMTTIRKAMSFGFRTFFTDFEFPGSDEWYRRLFGSIAQEQLGVHFVYSSWGLASKCIVDTLSQSFEKAFIQLSPETADVELRRKNKGGRAFYTNEELRECLDYIGEKQNLRVQLYFGYFLAFDRCETVIRTIEFIMELLLEYPELIEVAYLPFSTDPGSLLFSHAEEYDVDMDVRSFQDYLEKLEDAYVVRKVSSPDMRLFRPRGLSRGEAVELERKIELFRYLFETYRRSVSYILEKTGSPEAILRILREKEMPVTPNISTEIKEALLRACEQGNVANAYALETVDREWKMQEGPRGQRFRARPQIWLDCETKAGAQEGGMELFGA